MKREIGRRDPVGAGGPLRIAMLVTSGALGDHRVMRQAEALVGAGYVVRIWCMRRFWMPEFQTVNGVEIVNHPPPVISAGSSETGVQQRGADDRYPGTVPVGAVALRAIRYALRLAGAGSVYSALQRRRDLSQLSLLERQIVREVVAWGPDVVHQHDFGTLRAADRICRRTHAKLVSDMHDVPAGSMRTPGRWSEAAQQRIRRARVRRGMRRYYSRTDLRFAASAGVAQFCAEMSVVEPGIPLLNAPRVSEQVGVDRSVSDDATRPAGQLLLVYVGLVRHNRGIEDILDALTVAADFDLAIVGGTMPNIDFDFMGEIQKRGLESRVHHLGFQPQRELLAYLATADVGVAVIPPVTANNQAIFPSKFLEMVLAGLPVVVYDTGPMGELASKIASCHVIRPGSTEELVAAIRAAAVSDRLPAEALTELRRRLGWEAQERVLLDAYEKLLGATAISRA